MLTALSSSRDRVRTLRATVRAPAAAAEAARDPLALRLALERVVGAAELRPRALPPGAILCVRHVRVAAPRRHGGAWSAGVQREMEALLRGAARPFREAVPAGASAVLFDDEAELLACLLRDWRRGEGGAQAWWWRGLFGEGAGGGDALVQRALAEAPAVVPAALERLAAVHGGELGEVARALAPSFCERLGAAVAATFGVPRWAAGAAPPPPLGGVQPDVRDATTVRAGQRSRRGESLVARIAAVVRDAEVAGLAPAQRALVALSLLLRRAPAVARAPGLAAALHAAWLPSAADVPLHGPDGVEVRSPRQAAPRASVPHPGDPTVPAVAEHHEVPRSSAGGRRMRDLAPRTAGRRPAPAALDVEPRAAEATPVSSIAAPDAHAAPASTSPRRESVASRLDADDLDAPALVVDSVFAGVVYLVNLALYLELYGDFTQPLRPGLPLPIGDFLALVGERACGPALRDDPLWPLLAHLAGRAPDAPPRLHGLRRRRLDRLTFRMEARAARALGVAEGDALPFLCVRPGRVALAPTRLDATFSLDAHPIEIRLAGLDRDPGWVPAAGRVVALHYE